MGMQEHPRMPLALLATRAHCWLTADLPSTRTPRSLSAELPSSSSSPNLYWCMQLLLPRCKTLHLLLLNLIRFFTAQLSACPALAEWQHGLQPILPTSYHHKLAEGGRHPLIKVIDEDVEQERTQHRPLGDTTGYRSPARLCTANDDPLALCHSASAQPTSLSTRLSHSFVTRMWWGTASSLAEIKVGHIHCSPPIHPARDNIIEGHQVGGARPPPAEPVLTAPHHLLFFQLSGDGIQHSCSITFPGTESSGTSPVLQHLPKTTKSGSAITSASSLSSRGCIPSAPMDW
ncbi:uncharacterized protein LOC125684133 isoform X1 [Lagopus muta]|uniref:uncharacterized protein LOC125684133 isoform X1 n=1 Tax=Lagopus muta TaxID=64668 RepID=UPI00209E4CE1|nr:uncharacterized protein LOC125684133 isoform X1 [Lagopus muta]